MRSLQFPTREAAPPVDHIQRDCVIELPYLFDGQRIFVAVDERGWMLARGMGTSHTECEDVLRRLHDVLDAHRGQSKPRLVVS